MKVRWQCSMSLFVALACAAIPNSAQGQDPNAHLYIAHAAPGRNISSTTNPAYPVDVSVQGICIGQGISFGEIRGPYTGPPGTYSVSVKVADVQSPCGGAAIFSATIALGAGSNSLGIIGLNSSNHVTGLITSIDLSPVPVGHGRIIVANTTQQNLTGTLTMDDSMNSPNSASFPAGSVVAIGFFSGLYAGTIYPSGASTPATGPIEFGITSRSVYLVVLAGSTTNSSVQLIGPREIKAVF